MRLMRLIPLILLSRALYGEATPLGFEANYTTKVLGVHYFKSRYGHLHQNPSRYSQTLTTISCSQPVKMLQKLTKEGVEISHPSGWRFVSVGPYQGYLQEENLVATTPECFATRYPKFVESIDLDLSEIYYWGRLYDQYIQGRSRVR